MDFGIGSTVWVFDENNRVYRPGQSGPVWREKWRKKEVTGETPRSWIVGNGEPRYGGLKLPKSEIAKGTYDKRCIALSEADIDRAEWVSNNRYRISTVVDVTYDYDILQQIAKLVGYKEK